jgi:glutamate 5-kinase
MSAARSQTTEARRWVVKIGSALITDEGRGLDHAAIADWGAQLAALRREGREVVLVSSGAVAEGMRRLGWGRRPHALHALQAAAAVGQMGLVQGWEACLQRHGLHTAQVLLTHDDLADRRRYLNARSTLRNLLELGVVPVVNENDTVATEEIKLGDNDTLAALVSNLVVADLLVILTDQPGLYTGDPRHDPEARLIDVASAGDARLAAYASGRGGALGRGGMATKVRAAGRAARAGADTAIVSGREPDILRRLAAGEAVGSLLLADTPPLVARKQWIASQLQTRGRLHLDAGASRVIRSQGRSLLPVGVTAVEGDFERGELVSCLSDTGEEIARGLANYSAEEARRIIGHASDAIESLLGYVDEPELVHRDNLIVL